MDLITDLLDIRDKMYQRGIPPPYVALVSLKLADRLRVEADARCRFLRDEYVELPCKLRSDETFVCLLYGDVVVVTRED